jgi:hypothetical protein
MVHFIPNPPPGPAKELIKSSGASSTPSNSPSASASSLVNTK